MTGLGASPQGFSGVIEGFYGPPWTWDLRIETCRFLAEFGADSYLYAPKSDPRHREQWRDPYPPDELDAFARLVAEAGVRVGFAVSPGLSMTLDNADDRAALVAKFATLAATGIDWFCLALDDIPAGPDTGRAHGELCAWLLDAIAPATLLFVPTDYTSIRPNPYLEGLAATTPEAVAIGWTGPTVVADVITAADARGRIDALDGRAPWLWDNYPVNDGIMTERLFMAPLRGRDPALRELLAGYLANPMIQARSSQLPLASAMGWWHTGDAERAWNAVAADRDWATFALACDATHLRSLRGRERSEFLERAMDCEAVGLETEVEPWLVQIRKEAKCAARALAAFALADPASPGSADAGSVDAGSVDAGSVDAGSVDAGSAEARLVEAGSVEAQLLALARWTRLPDPAVSVFGPRRALRPVFGQNDSVEFVIAPGALTFNDNAIDELVVGVVDGSLPA